jgi:hypothetical protein
MSGNDWTTAATITATVKALMSRINILSPFQSCRSSTCSRSAFRVLSQVGSACRDLKRCNASSVSRCTVSQALFGKWASMVSRHTLTGNPNEVSLLHGICCTLSRLSLVLKIVPLNSSSNLMSSPGSGKTTLLERTIRDLRGELGVSVIEGDQETVFDAERIRATGCRVIQVNTGAGCHLEAAMLSSALSTLDPAARSMVFVENVGNLVCPALFDLGEAYRVVIMSVTEGADKPPDSPPRPPADVVAGYGRWGSLPP